MRKVKRSNSLVSRRARELKRESKATVKSGLGLVPKLGTALGIHDTVRGVSRKRIALFYCDDHTFIQDSWFMLDILKPHFFQNIFHFIN